MSRYVTDAPKPLYADSDPYWIGRLGMAVAVSQKAPESAREALEEFLRYGTGSRELKSMIRAEMKGTPK